MKNKQIPTKYKVMALILSILMILSVLGPVFYFSFAAEDDSAKSSSNSKTTAAQSVSSGIIVNYYSIKDSNSGQEITELTKDSPAFDLTIGLLDQNTEAIEGFDSGTSYAVIESTSFYGESTNTGTLVQTGNTNSDGPMKLKANFKNVKFNGQSNTITIRVGYTVGGELRDYRCSFMISQIPLDIDDTKKEPAPPPSPKIVIDECNYGGNTINTEQSFTLSFNYFNSSNAVKMENLRIEVNGGENFVIKNNSNVFYVEEVGPKGIKSQSVDFTALKSIKEDSSYPIELKFSYEYVINYERKSGEETTKIYIPVHKVVEPPRLTIADISCNPTEIEPEEESTITIQLANKGDSNVKNVSVAISGNLKSDSYVKEIGTITSGKVTSPTFTITTLPATKLNVAASEEPNSAQLASQKPNVDSKINGVIVVTFEDEEGQQHTIDRTFGLNVNIEDEEEMDGMAGTDEGIEEEIPQTPETENTSKKITKPILISIISGSVILLAGISFLIYKKIKKKKEALLDEDI